MKKYRIFLLTTILLIFIGSAFHAPSVRAADTSDPYLVSDNAVNFNSSTVLSGNYITISVEAMDDGTGITDVWVNLSANDSSSLLTSLELSYNGTHWIKNMKVESWWTSMTYISYVAMEDGAGNYVGLLNGTGFNTPTLYIGDGITDINPPTVNSVYFSQSTVNPWENVTLEFDMDDDLSGIDNESIEFDIYGNDFTSLQTFFGASYNPSSGFWEAEINVSKYWTSQIYVGYIWVEDILGNGAGYQNGTSFYTDVLTIDGVTPDFEPITINSLWFNVSEAAPGQPVKFLMDITDTSGLDYGNVELNDDSGGFAAQTDLYYNSTSGFVEGDFIVDYYTSAAYFYVSFIYMEDNAFNWKYYYDGTDFDSPNLYIENTDTPIVYSVYANSTYVYPYETVNITVEFDSVENISYVSASLHNSTGYLANIDLFWSSPITFSGTFFVDPDWVGYDLYIGDIYVEDQNFNGYYYDDGYNYSSPIIYVESDTGGDEGIFVDATPDSGFSYAGETFEFQVDVESFFAHDMQQIDLVVNGTNEVGDSFDFNSTEFDLYAYDLRTIDISVTFPMNGTYFIEFWVIDDIGTGWLDVSEWTVGDGGGFVNQDILLGISPGNGQSEVGEVVQFDVNITNTLPDVLPNTKLVVNGTSPTGASIEFNRTDVYLSGESTVHLSIFIQFNVTGEYSIDLYLLDYLGYMISFEQTAWHVSGGDSQHDEISVSVSPNFGESIVNETVEIKVNITSTFSHTMENITLVVNGTGPDGGTYDFNTTNFTLPEHTSLIFNIPVRFVAPGHYAAQATVIDDIGTEWSTAFEWNVDDTSDTNTTNTDTTGTNSTDGGVSTPALPVPAFELVLSFFTISAMVVVIQNRRKFN